MKKIMMLIVVGVAVAFSAFSFKATEYELQIAKGSAESVQKVMKKFAAAHEDIEAVMNHKGDVYVLWVGGCTDMATVTALKNKLSKEYPDATIEACE